MYHRTATEITSGGNRNPAKADGASEGVIRQSWPSPGSSNATVPSRLRRRRPLMSEYAGKQFVGIDLHRRRSVIVRNTADGGVLETVQILNDVDRLRSVMANAGVDPEVVLEATYGWYWAVDALRAAGAQVHLAHP